MVAIPSFRFRARDESRRLKWGDVKLSGDEANGGQCLIWQSERGSKTRNGNGQQRAFNPIAKQQMANVVQ